MLGAMVGVREGTHFDVDVWPELKPRANALLRIVVATCSCWLFALVFVWWGIAVHALRLGPDLRDRRAADVDSSSSPGRCAGATWVLFLGEAFGRRSAHRSPDRAARMTSAALTPGIAAAILFGGFFALLILRVPVAFALGAVLPADPGVRAAAVADDAVQRDLQGLQLVHPARGAVLPADREPDERRRHHRPAGAPVAHDGGPLSRLARADQRRCSRCSSPGISGSSTADAASQGKIFIEAQVKEGYGLSFSIAITAVSAVLAVIIPPSILMVVWGGVHLDLDRRALPGRHPSRPADRRRADGSRCTSTPRSTTIRSTRARR